MILPSIIVASVLPLVAPVLATGVALVLPSMVAVVLIVVLIVLVAVALLRTEDLRLDLESTEPVRHA